jgi:glycosyltransferase involved in cell wall biosynthesis
MKIAFLAPRYHTNQISLIQYLLKSKHQVSFYVTRTGKSEDHSSLKPIIIKLNYISRLINFFVKSNNVLFDFNYGMPSIKELLKFKSNRYDLIIIREPNKLMGLIYFLWAKIIGVKIITYFQREVHKKESYKIKDMIEKTFIKIFNNQCISPCLGNLKFKKFTDKITYLPFCFPVNSYKKKWFLNNRVNILTIGKFMSRKNHLLLIRALSMLKVKNNFQLTIVGECSNKEHLILLKKVKTEIKLRELKVNILTNIKPNMVKNIYKKHDLFVLPSVNEPASVSNLEAMAYGLPVITTDTNQTSCYTERGINGFIVKSNNIEDLSKKLESLINNKDKLKKFGNKNFNIVKKKYNPEVIYKKYFETILKP